MSYCARLIDELTLADSELRATLEAASPRSALASAVTRAAHPVAVVFGTPWRMVYSDAVAERLGAAHTSMFARQLPVTLSPDSDPGEVLRSAWQACGADLSRDEFAAIPIPSTQGGLAAILCLPCLGQAMPVSRRPGVQHRPGDDVRFPVEQLDSAALRSVLDAIDQGCLVMNEKFEVVSLNRKAAQIARRSQEQILGASHWSLWPSSVGSIPGQMYRRVMQSGQSDHVDHHYVGEGIDLWLRIHAHRTGNGIVSLFRDITRDMRLLSAEAGHRARWNAARAAVSTLWTLNPAGRMDGPQPGWEAVSGQRVDEYQGYGWLGAIHPDDLEWTSGAFELAVTRKTPFEATTRVRRPGGTWRALRLRVVPVVRDTDQALVEWVGACHEAPA